MNQEFIGPPKLTRFERARVIGTRALQITLGAPLLLPPSKTKTKPIDIAIMELEKGILPITIRRKMPGGTYVDIPLKELVKTGKK